MEHILEVLNKELKERKERAREWYDNYQKLYEDYHDLKTQNDMLRKDLQELSKEHFKK
tara:strand:+ start:1514 stop:1687 length:174 start_codon:yes stop_codon:yes gene_type:complete